MPEHLGPSPSRPGSGNHRLPSIPTLPPLEIPRSNFQSSLNNLDDNNITLRASENDDALLSSGQLSVESFTTACSSPLLPANAADTPLVDGQSSTQTPTAPQSPSMRSLPKSLSVDSFVREQQHQRDDANEPPRIVGTSKSHSRLQSLDPKMQRLQSEQISVRLSSEPPPPVPPRNAGAPALRTFAQQVKRRSRQGGPGYANISEDEVESSPYEDSEFEQGRPEGGKVMTKALSMRSRLTTPKRSGSMPVSRASSQLQGSRPRKVPAVMPGPNLTKLNTTITHATPVHERSPQLRAKASAPTPLEATRRGRSFSVGTQSDDSITNKAKPSLPLHIDTERPPRDAILMTLAVIGSRNCGKSAFIRRGWRNSLVTKPAQHSVRAEGKNGSRVINYITQKVYMQAHEGRDYYLTLIEISVQELEYADSELHGDVWPAVLPRIDGAFVLYDASDRSSFIHTEELIRNYYNNEVPYIVLACKSDLDRQINPSDAIKIVNLYEGGIVEISSNESGRDKARRCVGVLLRGVIRRRCGDVLPQKNPCSPVLYNAPSVSESLSSTTNNASNGALSARTSTPTTAAAPSPALAPSHSASEAMRQHPPPSVPLPQPPSYPSITSLAAATALPMTPPAGSASASPNPLNAFQSRSPLSPASPTRARSMGDMNMISGQKKGPDAARQGNESGPELNRSKSIVDLARTSNKSNESVKSSRDGSQHTDFEPVNPFKKDTKQEPASPWSTLDELLEKLFFLAISGDDPSFISHFFLTYRRFTTPRRILLAMQKRMIELNQPTTDFTLAAFAQMRVCNLLEDWIQKYRSDFAVPGTAGALNALIRQILKQPHTLYYGTDFLPFLESLHTLQDLDSAWAVKAETSIDESDEDSNYDSDFAYEVPQASSQPPSAVEKSEHATRPSTRERKSSIPLSAKNFLQGTLQGSVRAPGPSGTNTPGRDNMSRLVKASNNLLHFDSDDIAKEITRQELELYMKIEPRDWLRHTLVSGKKDPNSDRIARFNASYNDLHDWAASMILCHDKANKRAKVVEKLAEVAVRLRNMNNYSGLRAIITAITQSTYPNDEVMEIFKTKIDLHKKYLSSDILMRTAGAHQSYRLALRNTKGPCIPCLEVHTSDLRRAHEGNPDFKPDDPSKIHWAKFNMIGKFISTTTELQDQCRGPDGYNFSENAQIGQLFDVPNMDYDLQQDRLGPPPESDGDMYSTPLPPHLDHSGHSRDAGVIKRLFFWS